MGKLKSSIIEHEERMFLAKDKQFAFNFDDSDAPSPSWELEFNEWLDAYEASFGSNL